MVNMPLFTGFYTSQVVQDFFHQLTHGNADLNFASVGGPASQSKAIQDTASLGAAVPCKWLNCNLRVDTF